MPGSSSEVFEKPSLFVKFKGGNGYPIQMKRQDRKLVVFSERKDEDLTIQKERGFTSEGQSQVQEEEGSYIQKFAFQDDIKSFETGYFDDFLLFELYSCPDRDYLIGRGSILLSEAKFNQ